MHEHDIINMDTTREQKVKSKNQCSKKWFMQARTSLNADK